MSDVHNAAAPAGQDQVIERDDGLTAEEGQQFDAMQQETSKAPAEIIDAPAGGDGDGAAAPAGGGGAAAAAPADGAGAAVDDDDDDAAGAAAAGADGAKPPRRVSYSKYNRETQELKAKLAAAEGTVAEQRAMQARLDERMKIIDEALRTPPAAEQQADKQPQLPKAEDDPEPDMEADIFAWAAWSKRDNARMRQEFSENRKADQTERQTERQEQATNTAYLQDAERYAGEEPNFVPAYQFLMASRTGELAVHYFGKDLSIEGQKLTQEEFAKISRTIEAEERQIVRNALAAGRRPAAQLYATAKTRGFRPAAAAAPVAGGKPAAGNGAAKPAAAADGAAPGALGTEQPKPSVADEVARIRNGQDASLSLSGGGGAAPAPVDAMKLANMPQDEFEAYVESLSPTALKKMMGG